MLAGVVSPPIIIAGAGGANLGPETTRYLVSTSLIVCGVLSLIQITRFHIRGTSYVSYIHEQTGPRSLHRVFIDIILVPD